MYWYESDSIEKGTVLTCRIRLARNLKGFPFTIKANDTQAEQIQNNIRECIEKSENAQHENLEFIEVNSKPRIEKLCLIERHIISLELAAKDTPAGVLLNDDESIAVMINEEDHIRIQSLKAFDDIEGAWAEASRIDDMLEKSLDYAYNHKIGYLTSCPTNVGTGMRASFMVHIPLLETSGQLKNIMQAISKLGLTARGIYGEGTESLGSIYQISNQVTLGMSELEIINNLKNVVKQITDQEDRLREKVAQEKRLEIADKVYRSYGVLKNARKISVQEAMACLSDVRLGLLSGIFEETPQFPIYRIMMNIQSGSIQKYFQIDNDAEVLVKRADYIRANL